MSSSRLLHTFVPRCWVFVVLSSLWPSATFQSLTSSSFPIQDAVSLANPDHAAFVASLLAVDASAFSAALSFVTTHARGALRKVAMQPIDQDKDQTRSIFNVFICC